MEAIIILVVIFLFLMIYFNPRLDVVNDLYRRKTLVLL